MKPSSECERGIVVNNKISADISEVVSDVEMGKEERKDEVDGVVEEAFAVAQFLMENHDDDDDNGNGEVDDENNDERCRNKVCNGRASNVNWKKIVSFAIALALVMIMSAFGVLLESAFALDGESVADTLDGVLQKALDMFNDSISE
jgi:hypothetical protein